MGGIPKPTGTLHPVWLAAASQCALCYLPFRLRHFSPAKTAPMLPDSTATSPRPRPCRDHTTPITTTPLSQPPPHSSLITAVSHLRLPSRLPGQTPTEEELENLPRGFATRRGGARGPRARVAPLLSRDLSLEGSRPDAGGAETGLHSPGAGGADKRGLCEVCQRGPAERPTL